MAAVKVVVNLPAHTVDDLRAIARERGETLTGTLKHAIGLSKYIREQTNQQSRVLIQKSDLSLHQLPR